MRTVADGWQKQAPLPEVYRTLLDNGWVQLSAGIVAMVAIANLQYGWALFVEPIDAKFHWGRPAIQVAFTFFVLVETWLMPIEGYLVDRFGPRRLVAVGGMLVGWAWIINAWADSRAMLYLGGGLGGIGAGIVYGTSVGSALKWFPHRRGLAAGLTAAAFGAGSALTVWPISLLISSRGYEAAFLWFGLGQGAVIVVCSLFLRTPPEGAVLNLAGPTVQGRCQDLTCQEMVKTSAFWLMYAMFTMVAAGGLMAVSQLGSMAKDFRVAKAPVNFFGMTAAALPCALALDRVLNGLARPFFGWISDYLGRENTMFMAFGIEGFALWLLLQLAHQPVMFVIFSGLTLFAWGEVYSLFPALCADLFGGKYATTNYGLLYTAKGTASLVGLLGSWVQEQTGSWLVIFLAAVVFNWAAAFLALFVLKPICRRSLAK